MGINLAGFAPTETAALLDEPFDIAGRAGLHCAPYAHKHQGTFPNGTVRLSVGLLTTAEEMREAAAELRALARDRIVIIVAHRPGTLAACDRVIFLSDGTIAACGTHSQLVGKSFAYRAYLAISESEIHA